MTSNETRCVVVVDQQLAPGLIGDDYADAAGDVHPGLITKGLPILRASAEDLPALRARAVAAEVGVISGTLALAM